MALGLGAVVVVLLGIALVVDLRDRRRGGERKVLMPRWGDRRARGLIRMSPIAWDTSSDRLRSPREEAEER
ncbi:hypothetical protein [Amycolatopsis dongchuanensis]|uniref:Secreted protein n=1 Tax=Amycolatopsis dongchuanensis TaxID=1070866 RepID=A0ABP8VMJ0_9PSEU